MFFEIVHKVVYLFFISFFSLKVNLFSPNVSVMVLVPLKHRPCACEASFMG